MGNDTPKKSGPRNSIKAPLGFSAILGLVAGGVTLIVSAGGTEHGLRWDLCGIAFCIAFVASLLIASLLTMSYKENPAQLGKGSGVNLRSEDRLQVLREKRQQEQEKLAQEPEKQDDAVPPSAS